MNPLLQAMRDDPDGVFEVDIDLPGGNSITATIRRGLNGVIHADAVFTKHEPSEQDALEGQAALNAIMGRPATLSTFCKTEDDCLNYAKQYRAVTGGGLD